MAVNGKKPKPHFQRYDIPREYQTFVRNRTAFLSSIAFNLSTHEIAMSAYLQGLRDATEALNAKTN